MPSLLILRQGDADMDLRAWMEIVLLVAFGAMSALSLEGVAGEVRG